ncbi:hypothetical protein SUGI_0715740 [Cryptomeria japonica]|nr:hypothetical protein SUGI_0715740 [Cryptomeria japonica]
MGMYVQRGFRRTLLQLIYVTCLIFVIGLPTQQLDSGDYPCAHDNSTNGLCGLNGICRDYNHYPNCTCLPGFEFVDPSNPFKGCLQNAFQLQTCGASGTIMQRIETLNFPGSNYKTFLTSENDCEQACLEDCFCTVAVWSGNGTKDSCELKAMPLRYSYPDFGTTFVKVYSDALPPTKEKGKKGKGLVVIGISLMGCFLLIQVILLIVLWVAYQSKTKAF